MLTTRRTRPPSRRCGRSAPPAPACRAPRPPRPRRPAAVSQRGRSGRLARRPVISGQLNPRAPTASTITHGSSWSPRWACASISSERGSVCSSDSPLEEVIGTRTTDSSARANGPQDAQRRNRGQNVASSTASAAVGTTTTVAWTISGWRGRPKTVMGGACRGKICEFLNATDPPQPGVRAVTGVCAARHGSAARTDPRLRNLR